jgi:D-lactate dehydrogenase (cytochrome)
VTDDWRLPTADCRDYLEDAAHYPGGHAAGVVFPRTTDDVAEILATSSSVLPIGAQSSLTGGATPMGELILATTRMARILDVAAGFITVQPGVTVAAMQERLAASGAWFPPAPTFTGACAGGIVATNAAGAATFKYGSTRNWVEALTVVLADGTVLELRREKVRAQGGQDARRIEQFEIDTRRGQVRVPVPGYSMPQVAKRSAGYHAAPGMDLIDLFIGSEGTLGVITQITFRTLSPPPNVALAFVPCSSEGQGLAIAKALRDASKTTWSTRDPAGIDVSAIEHLDERSLEVVREDGVDARCNVAVPRGTALALLVQLELSSEMSAEDVFDQIQESLTDTSADTPLVRFCRLLEGAGLLSETELALPHDKRRASDLLALREAVPAGVNRRVGEAKRTVNPRIEKTAADMIVPFERFAEMMAVYRTGFESRGLDYAIWGHLSDGNVHPNVIPRSLDDVVSGKEAMMEFGREVVRLGGCPLAEHGVGRNPIKQALLQQLYGQRGIDQMRAVKRALDPGSKLAPGVIFAGRSPTEATVLVRRR